MKNQPKTIEQRIRAHRVAKSQLITASEKFAEALVCDPNADDTALIAAGRKYRAAESALREKRKKDAR